MSFLYKKCSSLTLTMSIFRPFAASVYQSCNCRIHVCRYCIFSGGTRGCPWTYFYASLALEICPWPNTWSRSSPHSTAYSIISVGTSNIVEGTLSGEIDCYFCSPTWGTCFPLFFFRMSQCDLTIERS
jgi:hypothetical protein